MPSIRNAWKTDDVNGVIIGEITPFCARLYYQGRPQGQGKWFAEYADAAAYGETVKAEIKADCGPVFNDIYPDAGAWECRVFYE